MCGTAREGGNLEFEDLNNAVEDRVVPDLEAGIVGEVRRYLEG
jgi:hypothetical protein